MAGDDDDAGPNLPVPQTAHPNEEITIEHILARKIEESDDPEAIAVYVELLGKVATQHHAVRFQLWQMGMATVLIFAGIGFAALGTAVSFLAAFVLIGGGLAVLVPEQVGDIMKQAVDLAKTLTGGGAPNGDE